MAKVEIIRSFLASRRRELPATADDVGRLIDAAASDLNFRLTAKERQGLLDEFAPEAEKKPKRASKASEATEAPAEPE